MARGFSLYLRPDEFSALVGLSIRYRDDLEDELDPDDHADAWDLGWTDSREYAAIERLVAKAIRKNTEIR